MKEVIRILSINSHTGYHYMLSKTGYNFNVIGWDYDERNVPSNVNIVSYDEAVKSMKKGIYTHLLLHKPSDLEIRRYVPKKTKTIYVFHGRFDRAGVKGSFFRKFLKSYFKTFMKFLHKKQIINHFVFITPGVKVSWGLDGYTIIPGIDTKDFQEATLEEETLLIVGNNLHRHYFDFSLIQETMEKYPTKVIGENPYISTSKKAKSFEELKEHYAKSRVFVYFAREPEEGFNLSLLEAMASGLPIITMFHPSSPIRHFYNGLVAFNKKQFFEYCEMLLKDRELAYHLGKNAKKTVEIMFSINDFKDKWKNLLLEKWEYR